MSRTMLTALGLANSILYSVACGQTTPTAPSTAASADASAAVTAATTTAHAGHHGSSAAGAGAALGSDANQQIAQVRALLAPFHDFDNAVAAGYEVPAPGPGVCISDPARGGMGYHYTSSKKDLIGDGVVNLLEPEFIVYSPTRNGGVRLSSADYFVPYATWPHANPPSLLGVPFAREDAFQAWVLHIWVFWPNPAGIFENFNPDVPLCP